MWSRTLAISFALTLCCSLAAAADKLTATEFIELARSNSPGLQTAITSTFDSKELKDGTAWSGRGPDFFFVTNASSEPQLMIDGAPGPRMQHLVASDLWYAPALEQVGQLPSFYYLNNGTRFGGSIDVPAFDPLSYLQPGVLTGTLSPKIGHVSKIYDEMKSDYWFYVPAQYDPATPAALMVFQDGHSYIDRNHLPTLNVIDNLIAEKKIPVMICVFIDPGDISDSPDTPTYKQVKAFSEKWQRTLKDAMRSVLYDTVSDRYAHFLLDEVLAEVSAKYNLRKDAYSRGITGLSSGGMPSTWPGRCPIGSAA